MVLRKQLLLSLCFVVLGTSALFATEPAAKFEFRAVNLGKDEKGATAKLNELMSEGWEIHGVVGNNLTAFRRPAQAKKETTKPEPKKEESKKDEPKRAEPKPEKTTKEEPKPDVKPSPEKPAAKPKNPDEAPEVPTMTPIIDKIAAAVTSDPKNAPSPKLGEEKVPAAMMPEVKTIERPAGKPEDQTASATNSAPRSVLKSGGLEELPNTIARVPVATEIASLQGTWSLVVYILNGREVRADDARSTWTVAGDRWTSKWVSDNGATQIAEGVMRIVEQKNGAKSVDLVHTTGQYKGRTTYSIFQLEGDVLKYCYTGNPELRPQSFASSEGDGLGLVLWRKVK